MNDPDLEPDCCPVKNESKDYNLGQNRLLLPSKHSSNTDERFDSRYSSGYKSCESLHSSDNLGSEIREGRYTSDEDNLIPVAGLESLTLDPENSEKENIVKSVDEGFVSEDFKSTEVSGEICDDQSDKRIDDGVQQSEQEEQYKRLVAETFQQDDDGDTRLHTAIIQLLTDLALYFIYICPSHIFLNLKNNYLQTPLHLAVITKQDVITRKLMTTGAQVDSRDHKGNTPLHIASKEGYAYFARILLEPIHYEETKENTFELPYQEIPQNLEGRNYDGQMCVHLAAEGCHLDTLDVLLSKGADINARDGKSGRTILHYAAESGCLPLLEFLLKQKHRGLNVECTTYGGLTPILLAKGRGNEQAVALLKAAGAWYESEDSSEEEMNEEMYEDVKINGVIVSRT